MPSHIISTADVDARLIWENKEFCDDEMARHMRRQKAIQQLRISAKEVTEENIHHEVNQMIERQFALWYANQKMLGLVR